jgi:ribosome-associated protein
MIRATPHISIDDSELEWSFVRSSGPGGQNVNKVATAVQLRFNAAESPNLPDPVRQRLLKLAGSAATSEGEVVLDARGTRSQKRNRQEAMDKLLTLIRRAAVRPKKRRKTRPTRASRRRRLEAKRQRSQTKRLRKPPGMP